MSNKIKFVSSLETREFEKRDIECIIYNKEKGLLAIHSSKEQKNFVDEIHFAQWVDKDFPCNIDTLLFYDMVAFDSNGRVGLFQEGDNQISFQ